MSDLLILPFNRLSVPPPLDDESFSFFSSLTLTVTLDQPRSPGHSREE